MEKAKENRGGRPFGTVAPRSDAVKRVRDALGITQEKLALELGMSVGTIQKMEQQNREPGTKKGKLALERLAKRAGVTL